MALINSFITSKVDYCSSLLYGVPAYQLDKLRRVQNVAATILAKTNDTRRIMINARLYAPSPLAMLIPELRKHAVLLANSSGNNLTPIYYNVQPTLSGGKGDLQHFTSLLKVFH